MIEQLKTIRHHLEPLKNNSGVRKALTALSELEAMVGEQEPVAWHVCSVNSDGSLSLEYAVAWKEAAHEHINDAINDHGIEEAASWVVRPAYAAAPPAQQPQMVGEVLPRWNTEKERIDGVRAHLHKELQVDTKLYAYLPTESKPPFPSGTSEAIENARNLGMDLS